MSGSLLWIELNDLRSAPVGYLSIIDMYPMSFEEFVISQGISSSIIDELQYNYEMTLPVDSFVHKKMIELFYLYSIIGGMPEAVQKYNETNNLKEVGFVHDKIRSLCYLDFTKYERKSNLKLKEIYNLIPSELNKQDKRFVLSRINNEIKFDRYENSFLWLKDAGVALPIYLVSEPTNTLLMSKVSNRFKLYMSDVGLLTSYFSTEVKMRIVTQSGEINNGCMFENIIAQELRSRMIPTYYFKNSKIGEVDFVIELDGKIIPLEIKSGKNSKAHTSLTKLLSIANYSLEEGVVFSNENVSKESKITYLPIYMIMFLKKKEMENPIYKIDLTGLTE